MVWKTSFFALILLVGLTTGNFAFAQAGGCAPCDAGRICFENLLEWCTVVELIQGVLNFVYWLAIPISGIMIIVSAFLFMSSAGDPNKLKQAKQALIYTVIGIVIVIMGVGGVNLIRNILDEFGGTPPA